MELRAVEVALWLSPGVGVSMAVPVRMTLTGKRWGNNGTHGGCWPPGEWLSRADDALSCAAL